jgi:hypothetical protein
MSSGTATIRITVSPIGRFTALHRRAWLESLSVR